MTPIKSPPKIGLAFSGASARSVFYIGFLEVLQERKVPIDYIAACSSGTIVAAAFACGNLRQLRDQALKMNKEVMFNLLDLSRSRGGVYNIDKVEEYIREFTGGAYFENVKPLMGFVAADLDRGEQVVLSMGDIAHAARISCTLPGVFQPVRWGSRTLVDGGILNVIPGDVARQAGMDYVVGINMRATRHIFSRNQILLKRLLNRLKRTFISNGPAKLWDRLSRVIEMSTFLEGYPDLDAVSSYENYPGIFSVVGRSLDLAIAAQKKEPIDSNYQCDLIISPDFPKLNLGQLWGLTDFSMAKGLYELGRQIGDQYAPQLLEAVKWQTIKNP